MLRETKEKKLENDRHKAMRAKPTKRRDETYAEMLKKPKNPTRSKASEPPVQRKEGISNERSNERDEVEDQTEDNEHINNQYQPRFYGRDRGRIRGRSKGRDRGQGQGIWRH